MPLFTIRAIEDHPIRNLLLRDHHAAIVVAPLAVSDAGW
jgi:hypothetical protein